MTPTDSICESQANISTKDAEKKAEKPSKYTPMYEQFLHALHGN